MHAQFNHTRFCSRPSLLLLLSVGIGCTPLHAQTNYAAYRFRHFAGPVGGPGQADGVGNSARFFFPNGVAVGPDGSVYCADYDNHAIRKISPAGVVTTLAGSPGLYGSTDGTGTSARFTDPAAVAVDGLTNVYVADGNATVRKITPDGVVTTLAGLAGVPGSTDGSGTNARLSVMYGIAVDTLGFIYVADTYNYIIRKVSPNGTVTTFAGRAGIGNYAEGNGTNALFGWPFGLSLDSAGNLYVADAGNNSIRKITPAADVSTLAGLAPVQGSADGTNTDARFYRPQAVAVDPSGIVYVADTFNQTIRRITPTGVVTTLAGKAGFQGADDGTGSAARFGSSFQPPDYTLYGGPAGIATDSTGTIYVGDSYNHTIRKVTPEGVVTTFAGSAAPVGTADGTNTTARFNNPSGIGFDPAGNAFVADTVNHTIRKVTPYAVVTTFAGQPGVAGSSDGTNSGAAFRFPNGAVADSLGNVFIPDSGNHTIRKITPDGVVTTFAGLAGSPGSGDGNGNGARFFLPTGIAVDSSNYLYVAQYNGSIRKISPSADVTTLVSGLNNPYAVAVDNAGFVYVAEVGTSTIRKVSPSGVPTILAGSLAATGNNDGTGTNALFNSPEGIAVDRAGNVFISDYNNNTIRRITPGGVVTTLAGFPGRKGSEDGVGSGVRFFYPRGLAFDAAGNLYVADSINNSIRVGMAIPLLTNPTWQGPGQFQFSFDSVGGTNYGVQYAAQLTNWVSMATVIGTGGPVDVLDTNAVDPGRIYRVVLP